LESVNLTLGADSLLHIFKPNLLRLKHSTQLLNTIQNKSTIGFSQIFSNFLVIYQLLPSFVSLLGDSNAELFENDLFIEALNKVLKLYLDHLLSTTISLQFLEGRNRVSYSAHLKLVV
jgi:hypothetical protein